MNFKNAIFDASGNIDLEYEHPTFGWIPFTANESEVGTSADLYAAAVATAAPYVAPPTPPTPVPTRVTPRQARLALLQVGKLPFVEQALEALPEPDRTAAKIEWEYASFVERTGPLTLALAQALELPSADVDALFIQAIQL